jgi:uncharacterized NAD(P)/FAD-binding protein YdhS
VTLFDQHGLFGRGLAYSTGNPNHLLNVRADMSAFAADPRHFVRWLWRKDDTDHPTSSIPPSGHAFVSRKLYGDYIEDVLDEAASAPPIAGSYDESPRSRTSGTGLTWSSSERRVVSACGAIMRSSVSAISHRRYRSAKIALNVGIGKPLDQNNNADGYDAR